MQERNDIMSVDAMMDERYGKVGTPEREAFRKAAIEQVQLELASTAEREQARPKVKEAYAYCVGQIISDARKREKITQQELAQLGRICNPTAIEYKHLQCDFADCKS